MRIAITDGNHLLQRFLREPIRRGETRLATKINRLAEVFGFLNLKSGSIPDGDNVTIDS